jgi:hypothetical protein
LIVKDANGAALGTLLGFNGDNSINIYTTGKYIVSINLDGTFFPAQVWWTGANCTGTPFLNDGGEAQNGTESPIYTKSVSFDGMQNSLFVATGSGIQVDSTINHPFNSIENPTCMAQTPTYTSSGWAITDITGATLGWTLTGNPLHAAGPLQLP